MLHVPPDVADVQVKGTAYHESQHPPPWLSGPSSGAVGGGGGGSISDLRWRENTSGG
jgi:hypothetical protein